RDGVAGSWRMAGGRDRPGPGAGGSCAVRGGPEPGGGPVRSGRARPGGARPADDRRVVSDLFEVDPASPERAQAALEAAAVALADGGLVVLPTETVYGIACRPDH